ncbi:vpu protein [Human immunodeficiency virus 1]|uniref:Protein Vpu n=1 Tax=Human immunodeficiency virus type 1 TaxID=11676 RepID=C7EYS7_HV1|nr:vpu protein [Human immunodeficiency virus 1]ACY40658.1 vpu protein [Human immunodeficiency virus 1]
MHPRDEAVLIIAGVLLICIIVVWGKVLLFVLKERERDKFVQRLVRWRERQEDGGYESNEEEEEQLRELGNLLGFGNIL